MNSGKNSSDDASDSFPIHSFSLRSYDFDFQSASQKEPESVLTSVDKTKIELRNEKEAKTSEESCQNPVDDSKSSTMPSARSVAATDLQADEPINDKDISATAETAVVECSVPSKHIQRLDDLELELNALLIVGCDTTLQGKYCLCLSAFTLPKLLDEKEKS